MLCEPFDDGKDARELFSAAYRLGPRPCRFATDVDDVRSFLLHAEGAIDGGRGIERGRRLGERIGGDVEDAHDETTLAE